MRKSIWSVLMATLAGLALFANIARDVFAPVYTIPFVPYMSNGFIPGTVTLDMLSRKELTTKKVWAVIFRTSEGRLMVRWKGNLAGDLVFVKRNDPAFREYVQQMMEEWKERRQYPTGCIDMIAPDTWITVPCDIPVIPKSSDGDEQTVIMCVITAVSIGHDRREQLNAVIVNQQYPYGRKQVYMPGGATSVAARFIAMGHKVKIFDLNLDCSNEGEVEVFRQAVFDADMVGISLIGAPYIPSVVSLVKKIRQVSSADILVGGQTIEGITREQFTQIFPEDVVQISGDDDLAHVLGINICELPDPFAISYIPAWESMGAERVEQYLRHEMPLVVSQGCKYSCRFCAARKGMRERFRDISVFEKDLRYLCAIARRKGIEQLSFYATSLDFFQNPMVVREYLEVLARVQNEEGIAIRLRCLSCVASFLKASQEIPEFGKILKDAGLWCVAVGVDGTSPEVWKAQRKHHNSMSGVWKFISLCQHTGIRGEALMVMGFQEDNVRTSFINIITALRFRMSGIVSRPYCAKLLVPGNDNWTNLAYAREVGKIVENPELFYDLDFAAFGSKLTHPRRWHRWMTNVTYGVICALGWSTSPLMPQGNSRLARFINRHMPPDR